MTTGEDSSPRILGEAGTDIVRLRNADGLVREVSTGCRDEDTAGSVLNKLDRRAELVKSEVISTGKPRPPVTSQRRLPNTSPRNSTIRGRDKRVTSVKQLRKTGTNLLHESDYAEFGDLFLDHESVRVQNYIKGGKVVRRSDDAMKWLAKQFGL